jgi:outer membrane protein OmpA-like peptidoglycan-associated protein
MLDNFTLTPTNETEIACPAFETNRQTIYNYNFRHKEMDYSLYGKGELPIRFNNDSDFITGIKEPAPLVLRDTLKLGDVFFDFNKAALKPEATTVLTKYFLDKFQHAAIDSMYIEGHTDSIGSDKRNLTLSLQRCEVVRNWLLLNGVAATEILFVRPFGKARAIATNSTAAGRAINRRVELIVFRKKEK